MTVMFNDKKNVGANKLRMKDSHRLLVEVPTSCDEQIRHRLC